MPVFEGIDGVGVCVPEGGGGGEDCDITGGDCAAGGCFPTNDGGFGCFSSDGIGRHESCNPDSSTWTNLPCLDGLVCVQVNEAGAGACFQFCLNNTVCQAGEYCLVPIFTDPSLSDVGVCVEGECEDGDGDGSCTGADCNDADPNIYPGADETCNDGIDNNCNSQTDEGCGTPGCNDADGDGICPENGDCNDGNPGINPGAAENCTDGLDNNCNSLIDAADPACGGGGGGGGSSRSRGCQVAPTGAGSPEGMIPALLTLCGLGLIASRRR
jgi:MYXO-CTERM domain-containing protein